MNGGEAASSDVYADDFCMIWKRSYQLNNVVDSSDYAEVKLDMRKRLLDWIEKAEGKRPAIQN